MYSDVVGAVEEAKFLIISVLGGAVTYMMRMHSGEKFSWVDFVSHMGLAALVGLVAYYTVTEYIVSNGLQVLAFFVAIICAKPITVFGQHVGVDVLKKYMVNKGWLSSDEDGQGNDAEKGV